MTQPTCNHEPTNAQRAEWAKAALAVFTGETYSGDHPDTMHPEDLDSAIGDLICDLLHFAARKRMPAYTIHAHALELFETELAEEDCCDRAPAVAPPQPRPPSYAELLEALDLLLSSLSFRKAAPVLKTAGYSTDLWRGACRNARALIARAGRTTMREGGRHE